jgi:hypothetical protein
MKREETIESSIVNGVTTSDEVNEVLADSRNGGEEVGDDSGTSIGHLHSCIDEKFNLY